MPMFEEDDAPVPQLPPSVTTKELNYQGIANDVIQNRVSTLTTHIAGSRWVVTWYSQILAADGETRALSPNTLEIHQQYACIENLELKVTTAIPTVPSVNLDSQEDEQRGSTNVYANTVVPKKDDHFTARLPDGRMGLFIVTGTPEVKSIFKQASYAVDFGLLRVCTKDDMTLLRRRTVESYVFIRDRIGTGVNPVITRDEYQTWDILKGWEARIPMLYLSRFFNKEYATLTVPGQPYPTFDPFHAYFIQALFGASMQGMQVGLRHIPVMDGQRHGFLTLWDLLLSLDSHVLPQVSVRIPCIDTTSFINNPYMRGVRYSGMKRVLYPVNPIWLNNQSMHFISDFEVHPLIPAARLIPNVRSTLATLFPMATLPTAPAIAAATILDARTVTYDDCYVLSEHFYAHDAGNLTLLEKVVWDALETTYVNPEDLLTLINISERWGGLEQFYFIPILYALIPAATRGI